MPDIIVPPPKDIFRDSVATINKDGKRNFIYPKKPVGKFYNRRTIFSVVYLIIFFALPFIKFHQQPLMMLNVLERKFILFGMVFWPQDFFIFGIGMLTFIVFIIVFTVAFGRIFCGWACPQTIFMEMVFRKIEYWIDGDASQQKLLQKSTWTGDKIRKRLLKVVVFFTLSFLIANFFLAYIIGMDQLIADITNPSKNLGTLFSLIGFTAVFFAVYWWFREQACIVVCPYGRLQGVLLDKRSIVVAYDHQRGETRGKLSRTDNPKTAKGHDCTCTDCKGDGCKTALAKFAAVQPIAVAKGDCIDCLACVRVCPTGIDIRNGTQLECINCTACMDACDAIMLNIQKPAGLIRYTSEENLQHSTALRFTGRLKVYVGILAALIILLTVLLITRTDLDARLMRTAGMTYTSLSDGRISNLYNLKLANKSYNDIPVYLKLENIQGEIQLISGDHPVIKKDDYTTIQFFVKLDRSAVKDWKTPITIGLYDSLKKIKTITAKFIGPEIYN